MKITITVESAKDGGALIVMDPGFTEVLAAIDSGQGTTAHAYALVAYSAMLAMCRDERRNVQTGELPKGVH